MPTDTKFDYHEITHRVVTWAREHRPMEYQYNSPMTFYGSALEEKVLTREEYEFVRERMGRLWNYVGD